jgi:hypothetical protein
MKQADTEYFEEVFDFIVDDLGLQASVAAHGLFFGGTLGKPNRILIPRYVDDIIFIAHLKLISSIGARIYDRSMAAGRVPVPDTCQYLTMTVTRNRSTRSIAIYHVGYHNGILDCFELANCQMCSTSLEVGHKLHAIQANEQHFDTGMYQKAVGFIFYASLGIRPDITCHHSPGPICSPTLQAPLGSDQALIPLPQQHK